MKTIRTLLFIAIIAIISFSCKKEQETSYIKVNDTFLGTWDFVSIDAKTQSSKEFNSDGFEAKLMAHLNYVTENNEGKMTISDSVITTTGLTYNISSSIKKYVYKNGILTDSSEHPYSIVFSEPQSSCTYTRIGNDSISFPKGGFINISASTLHTEALAAKIIFEGNTLKFKEYIYTDSTRSIRGITYHTIQTGTAIISLHRN
jgi:hypothetical protein